MILHGEKIYLRPISNSDTNHIILWRNTNFVLKNFIYQKPFSIKTHETWLRDMVNTGKVIQYIIYDKQENIPVGSVYLRDIDNENCKAEYGIFIGVREALGKGFGSEAAKLIIQYGFQHLKLHKIMLRVFSDNVRAIKSYENAGFIKEAYLKDDVKINNIFYDVILMAIINTNERL